VHIDSDTQTSQSSDWPIFHRAYVTLLKFTPFVGPSIISNAPTEFRKAHYAKHSSSQFSDWPIFHRAFVTLLKFTPFVGPSIISNAPTVRLSICHVNTHNPYNRHSTPLFHSCKPKANLQPPGRPIECETSNIVGYETKVKCCFEDNCNMGILLNLTSTPKPAGIYISIDIGILGYPGVIPLATSTPGTISWVSFDVPLNKYYHFIGCIISFGWTRWPMKTILTRERLSDWTARYNASYRFSVADLKLF